MTDIIHDLIIGAILMLSIPAAIGYGLMMNDAIVRPPRIDSDVRNG